MNQVTKRRLLFQIALIIAVLGAIHTLVFLIMSRGYADTWVDYNVEGYQSTYITLHQMASIGVFLAAMGLAYLPFHFFNKENHLWMNSQEEPGERRKSAMLVSIGIGLAVLGLGTAATILHQNYSLTRETIPPHRWILLALVRAILGFVGVGIIAFGVFLYREPDLEFGEEQHLFRRRPLWQGGSVIVLGLLILFANDAFFVLIFHDRRLQLCGRRDCLAAESRRYDSVDLCVRVRFDHDWQETAVDSSNAISLRTHESREEVAA